MRKLIVTAFASASLLGLAGCANLERDNVATASGAAAGVIIGTALAGPVGTVLGAGAGAYLGDQYAEQTR